MKPTAVIMNVGRGPVIDEAAMVRALEEIAFEGAVLDVFDKEPLPEDHPFWRMDNVLLSPHTADHIEGWMEDATQFFVENFGRYYRGRTVAEHCGQEGRVLSYGGDTFRRSRSRRSGLAPLIHRTPVLTSRLFNEAAGVDCFFKCENFQRGGAFKIRGAANFLLSLPPRMSAAVAWWRSRPAIMRRRLRSRRANWVEGDDRNANGRAEGETGRHSRVWRRGRVV